MIWAPGQYPIPNLVLHMPKSGPVHIKGIHLLLMLRINLSFLFVVTHWHDHMTHVQDMVGHPVLISNCPPPPPRSLPIDVMKIKIRRGLNWLKYGWIKRNSIDGYLRKRNPALFSVLGWRITHKPSSKVAMCNWISSNFLKGHKKTYHLIATFPLRLCFKMLQEESQTHGVTFYFRQCPLMSLYQAFCGNTHQ